ncbi:MAG TPA: L,D-transpeptidase family protein [Pyrinomonadaceae bacterium]
MKVYNHRYVGLIAIVLFAAACKPRADSTRVDVNFSDANSTGKLTHPAIEASPVLAHDGGYKLVSRDGFTLRVKAPDATEVELFYQPVTAGNRAVLLQTLPQSADQKVFTVDLKIPQDFNGELWGRVKYPNGEVQETEHLLLARHDEISSETGGDVGKKQSNTPDETNTSVGSGQTGEDGDESARSDQLTGGGLQKAARKPGDGNVRITVNVPAFKMTLWQGDKEVKSNHVGVGLKKFPIPIGMRSAEPIGMRSADKIILNPHWIPPNSAWVRKSSNVEPYERIRADDPNNPLGKIKIPLGQAYLLHQTQGPSDIGNLVSHGSIRVMRAGLFEVTEMVARALDLPISDRQIAAARKDTDRRVIKLSTDIPVDINYDTMVVENGVLNIYPDVYDNNANTVENLRSELRTFDVDTSKLTDKVLQQMLDKVSSDKRFVIAIEDVKRGTALRGKLGN